MKIQIFNRELFADLKKKFAKFKCEKETKFELLIDKGNFLQAKQKNLKIDKRDL